MKQVFVLVLFVFSFFCQSQSLNFEATGTAPDWFADDLSGTTHTLYSDYLENGQIVVLEFMNANCPACWSYAPKVGEFYETYGPSGTGEVSLLALDISYGSNDQDCLDYIEDYSAAYPIINGNSTSYYGAEIAGTPTFYILFPDGTYTNICSSCLSSSSSSNIHNDLGGIVDNWIAMSMGANPWGDAPDTDCNATILIQPTTSITLNGDDIDFSNWIGTFYTDADGNMAFGGGTEWNGETTSIAAWGSEAGMNNGFASDEVFTFGMIDPESGETIYSTDAVYSFGSDTYGCNGLSGISSLSFASTSDDDECSDDDSAMAPFDCETAVMGFTCEGTWNGMLVSEACPQSCDACGGDSGPVLGCTNDAADNYNPSATEDDGSCVISGCMCDIAINYD